MNRRGYKIKSVATLARLVLALVLVLGFSLVMATPVHAATITVTTNTNWSALTGGSGAGGLPNSSDTVVVQNAAILTVNVTNAVCGTLTLGVKSNGAGTLAFSAGTSLVNVVTTLNVGRTATGGSGTPSGSIDMTNGGTLQIGGTVAINLAGTWTRGTGTVEYNAAGAQTVETSFFTAYNNLTLSGSGAKTTTGATVNGILSMEGTATTTGTVATYGASATLQYKGSAAQTTGTEFPATWSGSGGVIINNASGVVLGASKTINNTLTLTSGKITTGANTVIISSTGSVSGGSSSSYVAGNLQKYVATGAQSKTFEVGTTSNYNPVTVAFNSVSVAGNLTAKVTTGEHPNITPSMIDSTQDVNAYWTLTNSGITFDTYSATFTFVSGDIDGGANTANFIVGRYSSGWAAYPTVGTRTSTSTQATGITSLSDFVIGDPYPWDSYEDVGRTTIRNVFNSTYSTVYMKGTGFAAGTYNVAYYDGNGVKVLSDNGISVAGDGVLQSLIILSNYPSSTAGTWYALAQPASYTAFPANYSTAIASPDTYGLIANDSFEVAASAIPEFPTVMAAIVVAGACFGIYWWMRRKSKIKMQIA